MNVFLTFDPQRRKSLLLLFVAGLCFWTSLTAMLPILPLYVQHLGGTNQQIGLVIGAFALGLLPSRIKLGPLADTKGRKLVLLIGATVAMIAPLGYLVIDSIGLIAGIRAFHGVSVAAFTIGYSALVADLAPENRRGEVIGYMSLAAPVGMAVGPAIGGFVQEGVGYNPLFFTCSAFGLLALFGITQVWEPRQSVPTAEVQSNPPVSRSQGLGYLQLLWSPRLRIPTLVMLTVGLIFGTLVTFLPLYVKESGFNLNAGVFYSCAAIASFTVRLFTGRASDRYGRGLFITIGLICYGLAMLLLGQSHSNVTILSAAFLEGMGAGIVIPMIVTLVTDRSSPDERGRFFSLCIGGFDLGGAVAGPIFGFLAEQIGYRNMFTFNSGLAFVALITFLTLSSKTIRQSFKFALGQANDPYVFNRLTVDS